MRVRDIILSQLQLFDCFGGQDLYLHINKFEDKDFVFKNKALIFIATKLLLNDERNKKIQPHFF